MSRAVSMQHVYPGPVALTDLPTGLDLSELHKRIARLVQSRGDGVGSLGFTLGSNDSCLSLLLGLLDHELGPLGILLGNLLLLDGRGELFTKGHVGLRESAYDHSAECR